MGTVETVLAIGLFVIVVSVIVGTRWRASNSFEVTLKDAAVASIPAVLVFAAAGQVQRVVLAPDGVEVSFVGAFVDAVHAPVTRQIVPLTYESLGEAEKGSIPALDDFVSNETPVLTYTLGNRYYDADVTIAYFYRLSTTSSFRYVVFKDDRGAVVEMCDGPSLAQAIRASQSSDGYFLAQRFVDSVIEGEVPSFAREAAVCVPRAEAIATTADKAETLKRFDNANREWLPVLEDDGQLAGVVERSHVTSSVLIDVLARLEERAEGTLGG
ncbi:MAG: hypothetical protein AAF608_01930 [Pseudomonadota bacterium]